ncbi:TonB-dependent siderophore receptor [Phenylobacterium aquaticum]|uniref:TonB-dependent receptor plug domain-containing protein n=1 Tax=Phenylobacterium aquaticum TaxID=1763816 RepID=UPI0026F0FE8F|nr:TonB-dependent receptor [Phenylobacterium aquaticum]
MNKTHLLTGVAASFALMAAMPAAAQSIDYGSLQELFGEAVTTSATGSPQRSTEAPADMQIISADEIRRSGETSLPGILQRVAGIDVLNHSAGQSDVNVRGYDQVSSPRLLVLVNGRQVYLDHYGVTIWATIPVQLDEIRQIEVVKGPNSALFGFNAVSGVVNIITYNPKFDPTNVVTARGGTLGAKSGSLVSTFKLGQAVSARLTVGGSSQDEWASTRAQPTKDQLHDPRSASANLDVVAQLAEKTELRMEGSWSNIQEDSRAAGASYSVVKMITNSEKATVTSDTQLGSIQAQVYQNQLTAKYSIAGGIFWKNTITVASLQDLFKVGTAHTFRLGGEYRHNTSNVAPVNKADVSYDVAALSGMWNWQVNDKLTTTAAMRVDKMSLDRSGPFLPRAPNGNNALWNRDITATSANATVAWRPTSADTFRLSYARGVQAPSLIELGGLELPIAAGPITLDIVGNPKLRPSIVTNYELAYDHDFAPIKAKLGVRLFNQDWKDIKTGISTGSLDFYPSATTNGGFTQINGLDSKLKGAEVTATGRFTPELGWRADYTATSVKDSPFAGINTFARGVAFQQTTPKARGNIGMDWEHGAWEADANLHYVGDYKFQDVVTSALTPVKAYASLSARLGYKTANGITLAVAGQNLLSDRQNQTSGLAAERRVLLSVSKAW